MKKTRIKVLAVALAFVMVAVSSSLLTVAYLTSETGKVTNTFSNSAKVKITLDELKVDEYGKAKELESSESPRGTANDYKLIPGHSYIKDPTIHVEAGSEPCYLFVKVTNPLTAIEAADDETNGIYTIATQMENNGWSCIDEDNGIYMYIGTGDDETEIGLVVDARNNDEDVSTDIVVFEKLNIASDKKAEDINVEKYNNAKIEITAYAVQADGFDEGADAWNASGYKPTPAPTSTPQTSEPPVE